MKLTEKQAVKLLQQSKENKEMYYRDLRAIQLVLGRKYVNFYVQQNNIKIIVKL